MTDIKCCECGSVIREPSVHSEQPAEKRPDPKSIQIQFCEMRRDGDATFWNVEAYPEGIKTFPVATAYVVEVRGTAFLNFILVADQWRRLGYGTSVIDAIRERWPDFQSTGPMDEDVSLKFAITTRSPALFDCDGEPRFPTTNEPEE